MSDRYYYTLEEVFAPFENDPEYQAEYRKQKPYYDLVLQIIKLRTSLHLTQKDLAEKAHTFQSRISKIETAAHDIRLSTLIEIAEALETEVEINLKPIHKYQNHEYTQLFEAKASTSPVKAATYLPTKDNQWIKQP